MRYFPNEYIESNSLIQRLANSTNQFINKCNVIFIFPLHLRQQKNIATVSCVFSNELTGIYLYNFVQNIIGIEIYLLVEDGHLVKNEEELSCLTVNEDGNIYITVYIHKDLLNT